jgi:hypothetical protein
MAERRVDMLDIHAAVQRCITVKPYTGGSPRNGGTCWRVWGTDAEGDTVGIGVETYLGNDKQERIILVTAIRDGEE